MLEFKNICVEKEGKKILKNINLSIDYGEMIAITGANGSGKSTLMKVVMGIEKPTSGQVFFDGEDITNLSITERAKLGISFAFQQPVKFKGVSISKLFEISAGRKLDRKEQCKVLSTLGLCPNSYLDRELDSNLSGGELKRLEIASILFKKSKCLIFDEPEAGIDLWSFSKLIQVFQNLRFQGNPMIMIVSHQEKLISVMDRLIVMSDGEIVKQGTPMKVLCEVQ